MTRDQMRGIIEDQRELYLSRPYLTREYRLDPNVNYCFVGIRRTGKSYLMYQLIHAYREAGCAEERVIYVNFEDERLLELGTESLNFILEVGLELSGTAGEPLFFLDEIQNVFGWEKFVRRLADLKFHVHLTGSNSKMLGREIASTLGGRFLIQTVYPYSFPEYLRAKGVPEKHWTGATTSARTEIFAAYSEYVSDGAFPELALLESKRAYLGSIYQTIYLGDILTRNKITNDFAVRLILKKIAESVTRPLSFSRMTNLLQSSGAAIGKSTVIKYVGYMIDSFLVFTVHNYAAKLLDKETSPKYYFMDTGLLGLFLLQRESLQLENLVAIELLRRYGPSNVFYFERNVEIDFYLPEEHLAIQVCYDLRRGPDTFEREIGAFVKLKKYLPDTRCLVLTSSEEETVEKGGVTVSVLPAWKWLVGR